MAAPVKAKQTRKLNDEEKLQVALEAYEEQRATPIDIAPIAMDYMRKLHGLHLTWRIVKDGQALDGKEIQNSRMKGYNLLKRPELLEILGSEHPLFNYLEVFHMEGLDHPAPLDGAYVWKDVALYSIPVEKVQKLLDAVSQKSKQASLSWKKSADPSIKDESELDYDEYEIGGKS